MGAMIDVMLALWLSSLRGAKAHIRALFTQEREASSAGLFLDGLVGPEQRQTPRHPLVALATRASGCRTNCAHHTQIITVMLEYLSPQSAPARSPTRPPTAAYARRVAGWWSGPMPTEVTNALNSAGKPPNTTGTEPPLGMKPVATQARA